MQSNSGLKLTRLKETIIKKGSLTNNTIVVSTNIARLLSGTKTLSYLKNNFIIKEDVNLNINESFATNWKFYDLKEVI